jgi:hypothetical protein
MGWLEGWGKRIKLTVDSDVVDGDLSDFPVLVYLSTASGIGDVDVSAVFDEVGANSKKIAIANSAGTEMYVEVVSWDDVGETAELWVKLSSVTSASDSEYYLYYDNDHADNDTYVKDQGDATDVWDSDFKIVAHMNDLTTSTIEDSTSNSNDGTKKGANEPNESSSGKIEEAQDFDGTDDYISLGSPATLDDLPTGDFTVSAWIYSDGMGASDYDTIVGCHIHPNGWIFRIMTDAASKRSLQVQVCYDTTDAVYKTSLESISDMTWQHVALVWNLSTKSADLYIDGVEEGAYVIETPGSGAYRVDNAANKEIGRIPHSGGIQCFEGLIDEVRISASARSAAWVKATYNSGNDSLITFGSEEEVSTFIPLIIMF